MCILPCTCIHTHVHPHVCTTDSEVTDRRQSDSAAVPPDGLDDASPTRGSVVHITPGSSPVPPLDVSDMSLRSQRSPGSAEDLVAALARIQVSGGGPTVPSAIADAMSKVMGYGAWSKSKGYDGWSKAKGYGGWSKAKGYGQ